MFNLSSLVQLFATVPGVFVLAALDSTFFFSLPLGIDAAIVLLAARHVSPSWLVALLATSGSLLGAALTFWTGGKVGEMSLEHYIKPSLLKRVRNRMQRGSATAVALLDLIPPPFPFSLFVLAAGAAKLDRRRFFVVLALCRLLRFGVEAVMGAVYGENVLRWLDSDLARILITGMVILAVGLSLLSIARLVMSVRSHRTARAA